jgi:hypothetical protein
MSKYYTTEELWFIEKNKDSMTYQEISERLGRPKKVIQRKCLALRKDRDREYALAMDKELEKEKRLAAKNGPYSSDEVCFIRENADKMTSAEIAQRLGRRTSDVGMKIYSLRHKKKDPISEAKRDEGSMTSYLVEILDREGRATYVRIKAETELSARLEAKEYMKWDNHVNRVLTI